MTLLLLPNDSGVTSPAFSELLAARERKWSVIPVDPASKHPRADLLRDKAWNPYQEHLPTGEEIRNWQGAEAFAVITGKLSGLAVLDLEHPHALQGTSLHLPPTVCATTPRGGLHYYFRHPGASLKVKTCVRLFPDVDVRGDGGYVVLPGVAGRVWCPELSPAEIELAPMPDWLRERTVSAVPSSNNAQQDSQVSKFSIYGELAYPKALECTGALVEYLKDEEVVRHLARQLRIPDVPIGKAFHCVMHKEHHPSASLYRDNCGVVMYRDWHERDEIEWFTLAEVRAALAYGTARLLNAPEKAIWLRRLFMEAGLLHPLPIEAPPLPNDASPAQHRVYNGFLLLLGLKWAVEYGTPSAFSWRFAAAWCGVSERHAGKAVQELLRRGYLQIAGEHSGGRRRMKLFLPGPGET